MKIHIWHSGPPPSIGWWPASSQKEPQVIRWWNGEYWSLPAQPNQSAQVAAASAAIKSPFMYKVEWCARWWE